tara:strand:- start:271 stop:402 length:132 start_codon:yes stop_codon:yes gene_type:complete
MNFLMTDWVSIVLGIIGLGLLIYINLDAWNYFDRSRKRKDQDD